MSEPSVDSILVWDISPRWMNDHNTSHTLLKQRKLHQSIQLYFSGHNNNQLAGTNVPPVPPIHSLLHTTNALSHGTTVLSFPKRDVYIFKLFCSSVPFSIQCNTTPLQEWRTEGRCLGGSNPLKIPKVLQNSAKLNPIVKTVKNCSI